MTMRGICWGKCVRANGTRPFRSSKTGHCYFKSRLAWLIVRRKPQRSETGQGISRHTCITRFGVLSATGFALGKKLCGLEKEYSVLREIWTDHSESSYWVVTPLRRTVIIWFTVRSYSVQICICPLRFWLPTFWAILHIFSPFLEPPVSLKNTRFLHSVFTISQC
jgi:hypothetical protein